ncbi:MurR/RpiR family transcriptional regulator [Mesorhizobium sp. J18]|uniref:MurR/RpiR family transcriptional regulator n=1 Tax=Mesorhizobium sp. J18 TaxID=935263 RepID=UPI0011A36A11|nr:MurR/RpiR family transcriptional regulator [Mesorhizobium sp. J18]
MDRSALADRIIQSFDSLPAQLGTAARYVLDNPDDVALLSMREQARRAGVQPWTMTRLAKRLGFDGYESLRALHAEAVRQGELGFSGRAGEQVIRQKKGGEQAFAGDIAGMVAGQVSRLAEADTLAVITAAAELMDDAQRIFCLGLRSGHAVMAHFAYVMSFLCEKAVLLGGPAMGGLDTIRLATPRDVLFVTTVAPYTRQTVDIARYAAGRDVPIVALTDSAVSPVALIARHAILVGTDSPSFFHTVAPSFVVAEILAALIAGRGGDRALAAIENSERQLKALGIHLQPGAGLKAS